MATLLAYGTRMRTEKGKGILSVTLGSEGNNMAVIYYTEQEWRDGPNLCPISNGPPGIPGQTLPIIFRSGGRYTTAVVSCE